MSIIYEALKKVENQNNKGYNGTVVSQEAPVISIDKKHKTKNRLTLYILCTILIILGFFAGKTYLSNFKSSTKAKAAPAKDIAKKKDIISTVFNMAVSGVDNHPAPTPAQAQAGAPIYSLEGIVYDSQQPFAIINGKMLKKDEMIDDSRVSEITATTVELLNLKDNTKRILSL